MPIFDDENKNTNKGEHLAEIFVDNNDKDSHRVIKEKEKLLTFMGTWRYKGMQSKEVEKQLTILTQNVIEAQTDALKYQLTLGLNKFKQGEYNKYLADIAEISQNIVKLSTEAALKLKDIGFDTTEDVINRIYDQSARFRKHYEEGKITEEKFDKIILDISLHYEEVGTLTFNMLDDIIKNSMKTFDVTLELFDKNKISYQA